MAVEPMRRSREKRNTCKLRRLERCLSHAARASGARHDAGRRARLGRTCIAGLGARAPSCRAPPKRRTPAARLPRYSSRYSGQRRVCRARSPSACHPACAKSGCRPAARSPGLRRFSCRLAPSFVPATPRCSKRAPPPCARRCLLRNRSCGPPSMRESSASPFAGSSCSAIASSVTSWSCCRRVLLVRLAPGSYRGV